MDDWIDRLRKSRLESSIDQRDDADRLSGRARGREWAMGDARYAELERIARGITKQFLNTRPYHANVHAAIAGGARRSVSAEEFWQRHGGSSVPTAAFIDGFLEGAQAVFVEVKDKL